jgi:transposase
MGNRQSRPWIVSDELWSLVEPLLPTPGPKKVQGRPRVPDRQALCGILFVLHTGIQWEYLPQELGFGSGMTCWRRLAAPGGVWRPGTRPASGTSSTSCC